MQPNSSPHFAPIPPTSLVGLELQDWASDAYDSATDKDGHCDYEHLDHELGQIDLIREQFECDADLLEVFVSEMNRGSF